MQCYTTYCDHIMRFKLVTIETNYLKKIQEHIFFQVIYAKTLSYQIFLQSAIRDEPDTVLLLPVIVFNNMNACLVVDEHF